MNGFHRKLDYAWRSVASWLCFGTFGIGCVLTSLLLFPLIGLISPDLPTTRSRVRNFISRAFRFFIGMARFFGTMTYETHGVERLAAPGQLIVATHPSLIDMVFISAWMPQVDCIVKNSLLRNPILRAPMAWADYIPNGAPQRLIEDCVATLKAGNSLLVFPEGTRSVPGQPLILKRGAAHIALSSGCDLLPVTIQCNPSALTKADVWYRMPRLPPHWCIRVGEPIVLKTLIVPGESKSAAARRVTEYLQYYFRARMVPNSTSITDSKANAPRVRASADSPIA